MSRSLSLNFQESTSILTQVSVHENCKVRKGGPQYVRILLGIKEISVWWGDLTCHGRWKGRLQQARGKWVWLQMSWTEQDNGAEGMTISLIPVLRAQFLHHNTMNIRKQGNISLSFHFFSYSSFSPIFQTGCKFVCKVISVKCVWNEYENLSILKRRNLCMFGQCRNCKVEGGKTDEAAHACLFIQSRAIFTSCPW